MNLLWNDMEKMVINMKYILEQEGGLKSEDTDFAMKKIKSMGLVILDVLETIKFLMVKNKYIRF